MPTTTLATQLDSYPGTFDTVFTSRSHDTALDFLRFLARELSTGTVDLPCFPDVMIRIRSALADPNTKPERIVTLVGAEPRLAARLLQTANSAAFNTSGKPLHDLRTAITRLGHQLVQSAAMAFAVQQMKHADELRSIAKPLAELWRECISVASVSYAVAKRTRVSPDEAFLTGLVHGIGRLYIMVRAVDHPGEFGSYQVFLDRVTDWHSQIGKAVLENWGFPDDMCNAVGDQNDFERRWKRDEELSDILIASIALAPALTNPSARTVSTAGITAFHNIRVNEPDCEAILAQAEAQLASLHDALG
jgi:HD-like signal output (HDOD) protein